MVTRMKWVFPKEIQERYGWDSYTHEVRGSGIVVRVWKGRHSVEVTVPADLMNDQEFDVMGYIFQQADKVLENRTLEAAVRRAALAVDDLQTPSPV